jgi:hypothetical protein
MTEQNKQPPAEDGAAIAVVDADAPCGIALTDAGAKLPIGTKLYTSQTTATQAAVAAAMRECAEQWMKAAQHGYGTKLDSAQIIHFNAGIAAMYDAILAAMPAEANEALEKICLEVIDDLIKVKPHLWTDHNIRAIVTSVIEKGK